jgi:serine phosphatase RsbU (regulator of sigma subunit)
MDKYKILIADESEQIIASIQDIIVKYNLNYQVIQTKIGRKIFKIATDSNPDLILVNISQTGNEGIKTIKIFKQIENTRSVPIIAITGSLEILSEAFEAGVDDFIYFPFQEIEVLFRLRFALSFDENIKKITQQNEQLHLQSEEMKHQYMLLEDQKKDIIDDITYSRRIQNAIMPTKELLSAIFDEYFLYFKPKRIVSGDFYWVSNKGNKTILAVADCTGHGISGAFLTIAGTAFLNEIIATLINPDAAQILNLLRYRIMRLLHQKGLEGEATDGMDISLCIFDYQDMTLQYAGANNPAYLVRKDGYLQIFNADRMPIGIHANSSKPFASQFSKISHGDTIYMFSDGYADQFGGELDQKFRYKRLQNLCVDIHEKPMKEQYEIFERTMDEWIGYRDQVDDMVLIGIRI